MFANKKIIIILMLINLFFVTAICFGFSCYMNDQPDSSQSKKVDREVQKAANQIYRNAQKLFDEGAYWSCAKELIILMDYYAEFEQMEGVVFYLAECLYEEELNTAALRMYKYLIKTYPESKYTAAALFGLEKTSYKEGNHKGTLAIYYQIIKRIQEKSVIDAARYFAGQSHYYLNNYDTAIKIFDQIDSKSEYYDAALYTTALAYLKKKSIQTAVDYLKKIIALPIISGERRRIVDDARLTLGYIYYELGIFKQAAQLFSDISDKHESYQDALLALGWANANLSNNEATIKPLLKLIELFPESANAEESYFLLGQAYIMLREYDKAILAYKTIVQLFPDNLNNSLIKKVSNSLSLEEQKIEKLKVQILIQESNLLTSLPLSGNGENKPKYLVNEKKKIEDFRENILKNLKTEHDNLKFMRTQIDNLKKLAERKEKRKDWRGYAEYGISRALFLKEMEQNANY